MNYDLFIVKTSKSISKQLIARHLANDPSISHQKALSLLDNLPALYLRNISEEKMMDTKNQLERLGVFCSTRESTHQFKNKLGKINLNDNETSLNSKSDSLITPNNLKRVQRINFSNNITNNNKKAKNSSNKQFKIIVFIIFIIILTLFVILSNNTRPDFKIKSNKSIISKTKKISNKKGSSHTSLKKTKIKNSKKSKTSKKEKTKGEQSKSKLSIAYLDSAKQKGNDFERAIRFYKIAISFNKNNLAAWQGLLKAYQDANMWADAHKTKKKIEEIFGENVFNIEKIIEPYGSLTVYFSDENGICRIEYSSKSSKKIKIEKETYLILRAIFTQRDCQKITLYASTGKGAGMLVRITGDEFPLTMSEFLKKASLTFVK